MPNFDKTGPAGEGVATGRGWGSCIENQQGNTMNYGCGGCRKGGRGFRNRQGIVSLDDQEQVLEKRLAEVRAAKKLNSKKDA